MAAHRAPLEQPAAAPALGFVSSAPALLPPPIVIRDNGTCSGLREKGLPLLRGARLSPEAAPPAHTPGCGSSRHSASAALSLHTPKISSRPATSTSSAVHGHSGIPPSP